MYPELLIPDHDVIRKIGGGAYGDVWLARGVTGALRAVKVVRRENFEDERGFQREFEGILKYEPISRGHVGLVNVLHVGRSDTEGSFYYYVMEVGDDVEMGTDINVVEYEPRNLRVDMLKKPGQPLDPNFVMDVGLSLAEALAHLHEKGLAHRDIKPANIIFVDGKAKLADIGLVAANGQRTFVGTEGFVPPEGPGTAQADIYGLGKVLYEMATGKDRLQFPELPDDMPAATSKKIWFNLNQVICDICEPRVSKRNIKSAKALADSLRRLQEGKKLKRKRDTFILAVAPVLVFLVVAGWLFGGQLLALVGLGDPENKVEELKIEYGYVKVISDPEGAEVYDRDGNLIDITPFQKIQMLAGSYYWLQFKKDGYRTAVKYGVVPTNGTKIVENIMEIYVPPTVGEEWKDNMGVPYRPVDDYHISSGYIRWSQWRKFEVDTQQEKIGAVIPYSKEAPNRRIALVTSENAAAYCRWQTKNAIAEGYLSDEQYMIPQLDTGFESLDMKSDHIEKGLKPFRCIVKKIPFAHLEILTEPQGAICQINGEYEGLTPCEGVRVKPGNVELTVMLEGYRKNVQKIYLGDGVTKTVKISLDEDQSVVFGKKWTNTFGMSFVPLRDDLLISIWETRVMDYAEYVEATGIEEPDSPGFNQGPKHPVLQVSRINAEAFCKWLTTHERKLEKISQDVEYRLLTDLEWSELCGLKEDPDQLPTEREYGSETIFPWGTVWPPEDIDFTVANLADKRASETTFINQSRALLNYDDGFKATAPVGSFPANDYGIYDLAGNAHEWVADDYSGDGKYGVLRGGGWNSYQKEHLYVAQRNAVRPSKASNLYGFRVALSKIVKKEEGIVDGEGGFNE